MKNVTKMILVLLVIAAAFWMAPQARSQTTLLTESFENGGAIPPNWATVIVSGSTNGISFVTSQSTGYPSITVTPYNGSYEVFYNSYSIVSGSTRLYRTAGTSTVGYASAGIDFAMFHDLGYAGTSGEGITPQYSIDGGASWTWLNQKILPTLEQATAVVVDPAFPTTLYAGTPLGAYKSIDGGASWKEVLRSYSITALATVPGTQTTVYASAYGGIYRSIDGGSGWSPSQPGWLSLSYLLS